MNSFLLALCQMKVCEKKEDNIKNALQYIDMAKEKGANIVVLPEMFCSPYDNTKFIEYSEPSVGSRMLSVFQKVPVKMKYTLLQVHTRN